MHKILVISAVDRDSANAFCNSIGAEGETFTVELYDAKDVLAGYWCGWVMTDEQYEAVFDNQMFRIYDSASEALDKTGWHTAIVVEPVSD